MTADPSTRVIQLEMASANYVPIPDNQNLRDRPFAAAVREAKADAQTAGSISLT
jgi:hypothetical protein